MTKRLSPTFLCGTVLAIFHAGNILANTLQPAVTQLGLLPGGSFTINGAGGSQDMVQILNPDGSGAVIGVASAAGSSSGFSGRTTTPGGQLNNFASVNAAAGVTIDPDFAASASAAVTFDFTLQLLPPGNPQTGVSSSACGPVPSGFVCLIVTDRFDLTFDPTKGNAVGQMTVAANRGPSQPQLMADEVFNPSGVSLSHAILVLPNEVMDIEMVAHANEYGQGGGTVTVNLDPSFQIDPNTPGASSFAFAVSPNLSPAAMPEPCTVLLVVSCLGSFGLRRRFYSR
jgi:hypothetical protein